MADHHHIEPEKAEEDEDWPEMDMLKGDASWRGKYAAGYMAYLNALVEKIEPHMSAWKICWRVT